MATGSALHWEQVRDGTQNKPLPEGQYDILYADPPWLFQQGALNRRPDGHYPCMDYKDIANFTDENGRSVADLALISHKRPEPRPLLLREMKDIRLKLLDKSCRYLERHFSPRKVIISVWKCPGSQDSEFKSPGRTQGPIGYPCL